MKMITLALALAFIGLNAQAAASKTVTAAAARLKGTGTIVTTAVAEAEVRSILGQFKSTGTLGTEMAVWPQGQVGQPCHISPVSNDVVLLSADPSADNSTAQQEYYFSTKNQITKTVNGNLTTYTWSGSATEDAGSSIHITAYLGLLIESSGLQVSIGDSARSSDSCLFGK